MFKVGDFVISKKSGIVYEITARAGRNPFNMREILWEVVNQRGLVNAFPTSELEHARQCSANSGGDPASGCDDWAERDSDLCAEHARVERIHRQKIAHDSGCHVWAPWWTNPYCTCGVE